MTLTYTKAVVWRSMSVAEAKALAGKAVGTVAAPVLPSPPSPDCALRIVDGETEATIALITRLPPDRLARLRAACQAIEVQPGAVLRQAIMGQSRQSASRVFGTRPRRAVGGAEACGASSANRDFPDAHEVLTELSDYFAGQFADMMPARAQQDRATVQAIKPDWFMSERSLWTSGVINRMATLPYHRDNGNMHTWSAMPTLRLRLAGGFLHVPEYNFCFPCRDGDVTWFAGKDLTHGVTSMSPRDSSAYRYSVVYYATASMVRCDTYAIETANVRQRRTVRERWMADQLAERQPAWEIPAKARAKAAADQARHNG